MKDSIKREQSQAGLSFAERKNFQPKVKRNKFLLLLVLLMTAATGAWAEESESITTTLPEAKTGSVEFTGTHFKITGQRADGDGMNLGSSTNRTITISALNGEIITKVEMTISFKFYSWEWEVLSTKGNVSGNYTTGYNLTLTDVDVSEVTLSASNTTTGYLQFNKFKIFYTMPAAPSSGYTVSMKDGVKDADKWKVKVGEGQAQALPIGGLKGDGSETVTLQYNGRLKVKGVKATSDAAPATVPVTAITLNKTETSIKVGATETLSVTSVLPEEATDKTYTWKTSDVSKATVDQDGKVTAVAAGTVTIYAEANDGSGVKGNCSVTVTPATITVTWNNDDITGSGKSFTKDGVTLTAGNIDFSDKNFMQGGTFTTTLGNFTKIEVTTASWHASGTGWSGSMQSGTWTGTPASSVSFSGHIMGTGMGNTKFVFTIEPTN